MHVLMPFCVSGSCPPESGIWPIAIEQAYASAYSYAALRDKG